MWGWRQAESPGETSPRDKTAAPAPATTIPARGVTASRPRNTAKAGAPELRHREGQCGAGLEVRRAGHFRSGGPWRASQRRRSQTFAQVFGDRESES